jgi:3-methyladenine DNA glycosylase AlkD
VSAEAFRRRLSEGMGAGQIFALAKEFIDLPLDEVDKLLDSPDHASRVGALSIMDKQARLKRTPESHRRQLYDLYLRRMDAIDTWDLVDLGAPWVIGRYLIDKPRDVLYDLARSQNPWERRTAIVSCLYFVRQGEVDDTFALAAILARDPHDYVRKATGGLLREAGKKDKAKLLSFLDEHAQAMPRVMLRYATERLDKHERAGYLSRR